MPPVINTYATRKKKRVRIPRFIYQDAEGDSKGDVFDALHIKSIKDKKAKASKVKSEKKKLKSGKENYYQRLITTSDNDNTFDRLLKEGPVCKHSLVKELTSSIIFNLTSSPETAKDISSPCLRLRPKQNEQKIRKKSRKTRQQNKENNSIFLSDSSLCDVKQKEISLKIPRGYITQRKRSNHLKYVTSSSDKNHKVFSDLKWPGISIGVNPKTSTPFKSKNLQEEYNLSPITVEVSPMLQNRTSSPSKVVHSHLAESSRTNAASWDKSFTHLKGKENSFKSESKNCRINSSVHESVQVFSTQSYCHEACSSRDLFTSNESAEIRHKCTQSEAQSSQDRIFSSAEHVCAEKIVFQKSASSIIDVENFSNDISCPQNSNDVFDGSQKGGTNAQGSKISLPSLKSLSEEPTDRVSVYESPVNHGCQKVSSSANIGEFKEMIPSASIGGIKDGINALSRSKLMECRVELVRCNSWRSSTCGQSESSSYQSAAPASLYSNGVCDCSHLMDHSNKVECSTKDLSEHLEQSLSFSNEMFNHFNKGNLSKQSIRSTENTDGCYISDSDNVSFNSVLKQNITDCSAVKEMEKLVLKPGKQWRRSLSRLSNSRISNCSSNDESFAQPSQIERRLKSTSWIRDSTVSQEMGEEVSSIGDNNSIKPDCGESFKLIDHWKYHMNAPNWARKVVLDQCGQSEPLPFLSRYPSRMEEGCKKIGEGVYGEVFMYSGVERSKPAVIKIIPIEGEMKVNGEPQKKFEEIISEISIARQLSQLRENPINSTDAFNELQAVCCVEGRYPIWLLDLWIDYDQNEGSENDSPILFPDDQLYIVLELSNGGKNLESFLFSSAYQGLAAFQQVALALAVGEKALDFEHRDLHWGNILISPTKERRTSFLLDGQNINVLTRGIKVSIIDFTLSRITDHVTNRPIYFDLASDETLFTAEGDYQFDVYRLMKMYCGNDWSAFTPKTNIAWLHYLLDKLCHMARYQNRTTKRHKTSLELLSQMRDEILRFTDAYSFVKSSLFVM